MIELFDCATHPTLNSNWLAKKYDTLSGFEKLIDDMQSFKIKKAFAIGMKGIGDYDEESYVKEAKKFKDILYPVAYFDLYDYKNTIELETYLSHLKKIGYFGIKLHPRFSNINFENNNLKDIIICANRQKLIPLVCTYFSSQELNIRDNLREIAKLMNKIPDEKVIFLHSGVVNLLEFVNMMKIYKNVLFDLSYTLCKYNGSALDFDIKFLFKNFDRRICIGSDHPEVTMQEFRERFEFFSKDILTQKLENIAYKNLETLIEDYRC